MPLRMSGTLRTNRADLVAAALAGGTLELRSGSQPANVAAPDAGILLCVISVPVGGFSGSVNGTFQAQDTWTGTATLAAGAGAIIQHFRFKSSTGEAVLDGAVSVPGGGGQMIINEVEVVSSQPVIVAGFSYTDGNR